MEAVTHQRGVVEVQFRVQRVPKVRAHLSSVLSKLHHVSSKSYALHRLVHLVEAVTHERGVVEVQFRVQRVPKFLAHLLSGLSKFHHVSSKSYALH